MVRLAPRSPQLKQHLDQSSRFCRTHASNQQTCRQITLHVQQQAASYAMHCDAAYKYSAWYVDSHCHINCRLFLESGCLGSGTTQTSESHSKNSKVVTADRILITLQRVLSVILIFSEYYSFFIDIDTVDTSHDFTNWLCFMTKSFSIQN